MAASPSPAKRRPGAVDQIRAGAWIEIENHRARPLPISRACQERVQLDRVLVRDPDQRGEIVDDAVAAALPAGGADRVGRHPVGVPPALRLSEPASRDAARKASQREWASANVG
jgi:hypothetical protein